MTINQALDQILSLVSSNEKNELVKKLQRQKMLNGGKTEIDETTQTEVQSVIDNSEVRDNNPPNYNS